MTQVQNPRTIVSEKTSNSMNWQEQVPVDTAGISRKGTILIFGFLGVFLLWAILFPISSAVVAQGKIVSQGQNKLIQHPTGGVIRDIKVADGDQVEKGQVLLTLDAAADQAALTQLQARQARLMALKSRLEAEADGGDVRETVSVAGLSLRGAQSQFGESSDSTMRKGLLVEQQKELDAGRKRLNAELDAVTFQIESLKDQAEGLKTRLSGTKNLLVHTKREIGRVRPLVEDGYLARNRLWDLDKTRLEQVTQIGNLESELDATRQRVLEAEARMAQLVEADRERRSGEMTNVIAELEEISDQLKAAKGAVDLTELRAPQSGTIVKLSVHTLGGVLEAGASIAEIVPLDAGLETEFRITPADIDNVKLGQDARIVVTAFNRRVQDPFEGKVSYVSADSEIDPKTGQSFFLARATMNASTDRQAALSRISSGMATEVYAVAAPRVFMSYALEPLFQSFGRAFRETN